MTWNPEQYLNGNYFQNKTSDAFRQRFPVQPFGNILDIGCGDGEYSHSLVDSIEQGRVLGIDSSVKMIEHANKYWAQENLSFEVQRIEDFQSVIKFDFIVSFWCLHWTAIHESFPAIFNALKRGGRVYAIFSSFSDNSILQAWRELAKQERYSWLSERCYKEETLNTSYFHQVLNIINQLPFTQVKLNLETTITYFPDISYFKNLLLTMPFMKQFTEEMVGDMLGAFQAICERKYKGELYYETRPVFLQALK